MYFLTKDDFQNLWFTVTQEEDDAAFFISLLVTIFLMLSLLLVFYIPEKNCVGGWKIIVNLCIQICLLMDMFLSIGFLDVRCTHTLFCVCGCIWLAVCAHAKAPLPVVFFPLKGICKL